jgi:hypothetical protein
MVKLRHGAVAVYQRSQQRHHRLGADGVALSQFVNSLPALLGTASRNMFLNIFSLGLQVHRAALNGAAAVLLHPMLSQYVVGRRSGLSLQLID